MQAEVKRPPGDANDPPVRRQEREEEEEEEEGEEERRVEDRKRISEGRLNWGFP